MPKTIPAIHLVDVTKADLKDISISREQEGFVALLTYQVRDDQGNVHYNGTIHNLPVSGAAVAALGTWAERFLPQINAQEGMS